jgi:hypothetical protein
VGSERSCRTHAQRIAELVHTARRYHIFQVHCGHLAHTLCGEQLDGSPLDVELLGQQREQPLAWDDAVLSGIDPLPWFAWDAWPHGGAGQQSIASHVHAWLYVPHRVIVRRTRAHEGRAEHEDPRG